MARVTDERAASEELRALQLRVEELELRDRIPSFRR